MLQLELQMLHAVVVVGIFYVYKKILLLQMSRVKRKPPKGNFFLFELLQFIVATCDASLCVPECVCLCEVLLLNYGLKVVAKQRRREEP